MKIELKNIKHYESMSEETFCFNANLYVDGKKVGEVSNRGNGGCHQYSFNVNTEKELDKWCKENLPKWSMGDDQEYETDLELHISNLVADFLDTKHLKSLFNKAVIVMDDTCEEGQCWQYKFSKYKLMPKSQLIDAVFESVTKDKRFRNPIILNNMPIEKAKKVYFRV